MAALQQKRRILLMRQKNNSLVFVGLLAALLFYAVLFSSLVSVTKEGILDESSQPFTFTGKIIKQPPHYPWNVHFPTKEPWNFQSLWKIAQNPDSYSKMVLVQLYQVRNGKLYGWKTQQMHIRQADLYTYNLRVQRYEQLFAQSLSLAHYLESNDPEVDPRVKELITDPFPFLFKWDDFSKCREQPSFNDGSPFFAFSTFAQPTEDEKCTPLAMPTYEQWRKYNHIENSTHWDVVFQQQQEEYPWKDKLSKAVWRGGTTGRKYMYPDWRDLPRVKLVQLSIDHPAILDARFVSLNNRNEAEKEEIVQSGLLGSRIDMKDFQKFKAIIDIDGNSWSSRFADLLCMNSVVIKVEPRWMDYFYSELQPWVHYVPANMSNLVEVVTMATSDDPEIQKRMLEIVRNANNWCRSKMTATQLTKDMIWIMISYLDMLKKEDLYSKRFTKWKKSWRWKENEWVEILYNSTT